MFWQIFMVDNSFDFKKTANVILTFYLTHLAFTGPGLGNLCRSIVETGLFCQYWSHKSTSDTSFLVSFAWSKIPGQTEIQLSFWFWISRRESNFEAMRLISKFRSWIVMKWSNWNVVIVSDFLYSQSMIWMHSVMNLKHMSFVSWGRWPPFNEIIIGWPSKNF